MSIIKSILKIFASIIAVILFVVWFINYPFQRVIAEKTLDKYLQAQNVDPEDIKSKRAVKDYKMGGYLFIITYYSDPKYIYRYNYLFYGYGRKNCISFSIDSLGEASNDFFPDARYKIVDSNDY